MKNYPTLFIKQDEFVIPRVNPEAEWVLHNVLVCAYRLYDGVTLTLKNRAWFYDNDLPVKDKLFKKSKFPFKAELLEALRHNPISYPALKLWSGDYELIGPNVDGTTDFGGHRLVSHNCPEQLSNVQMQLDRLLLSETDNPCLELFEWIQQFLAATSITGITFSNLSNDKYAQIKASDFNAL